MNHIELFAGCGGLTLGLKSANSRLLLANELSPMASETFAFNLFNEDLSAIARDQQVDLFKKPLRTKWLSSKFAKDKLVQRLRENPHEFPPLGHGICDLNQQGDDLEGSLIVGSITELNKWLTDPKNSNSLEQLRHGFGDGYVDLVSGGPPCQSFSMAGLRRKDCEKNSLPWEFAKFVQSVQPKLVLLENVTGILRAFRDDEGKTYYAWLELAKAFAAIGYIPLCLHVNAKLAGVPQNRPRFILIGVRQDFYDQINSSFNDAERALFAQPLEFFSRSLLDEDLDLDSLSYRDVTRKVDLELFEDSFLAPLVTHSSSIVTAKQAIGDLVQASCPRGAYSMYLANTFSSVLSYRPVANLEPRNNTPAVKRRFSIYQVIKTLPVETGKRMAAIIKGSDTALTGEDWEYLSNIEFMTENNNLAKFKHKLELEDYLRRHITKKQIQKALSPDQPAPAALSIPDDACHYDRDQPRTLSVREMARIQSFPDEFQFRSKVTTGGTSRRFEVPQYTQVGNAVPPLLGRALGKALNDLLTRPTKISELTSKNGHESRHETSDSL